ncbi:MAG: AAA family ATPase [Polyangiaceae bacterium]|nr:AAA family ATPase [Polyangiaceae bacterium]
MPAQSRVDGISPGALTLEQFLRGALAAAEALAKLHQSGIIHQSIRSDTLRIDFEHVTVELSGVQTVAQAEPSALKLPLESLPYIAPEQTGRFDSPIDHRVDLYSLGIVLYERWAAALPFHADDAVGWVHCHVARAPRALIEAASQTPVVVSSIVMKLLAKSPDERYQSARGLALDLERCLSELLTTAHIEPFPLGTRDVWDKLRSAGQMYGRKEELAALRAAVGRASTTREVVLVTGPSGIGKTALLRELQKSSDEKAFFLWGKFEHQRRDIPYTTIGQAFGDLVRQLLALPDKELDAIRQRLVAALGVNAQLVVDLVPQIELVIGKQPPAVVLPAADTQSRFNMTFANFVDVLATSERPIVLLLDDLQWADFGSLDLLQHVLTQPALRNLLMVGVYREEDVGPSHPLDSMLGAVRGAGVTVTPIVVGPLSQAQVVDLVRDLFGCEPSEAKPLASLLWAKTGGNPFFMAQLLGVLHEEKLIRFDAQRWGWRWDIADIESKEITDDLVELVLGKLRRLPEGTLETLEIAASTGNEFSVDLVATLCGKTSEEVRSLLEPALADGILLQRPSGYKFLHDRLVHAAYGLIGEDERTALHLRLGWLLFERTPQDELDGAIFDIVNQLNLGAARVESPHQRRRIAELDLRAGRKAKAAAAARTAAMYLGKGIGLLPEDAWSTEYALAYALHIELAECEFMTGRFEDAERLCATVLEHARTPVDKAGAYRIQLLLATAQMNNAHAIELGRTALRLFGIELPADPTEQDVRSEVAAVRDKLQGTTIESLGRLSAMTDPDTIAAMDILAALYPAAVYVVPNLSQVAVAHMVRLSILHGNAPASAHGYAILGLVLCSRFSEFRDGYLFGKLACDLSQEPRFESYASEALVNFGALTLIWSRPMRESLEILAMGFRSGKNAGKTIYAGSNLLQTAMVSLALGEPLDAVQDAGAFAYEFLTNARFGFLADNARTLQHCARSLRGETERFGSLTGDGLDEVAFEKHLQAQGIPVIHYLYAIYKLVARYHAGEHADALAAADLAEGLIWSRLYSVADAEFYFYAALAVAAAYQDATEEARAGFRKRLTNYEDQLRQWSESCPDNFRSRHHLVSAEIARIDGRDHDAIVLYDKAIRFARESGFVHVEGLACELAGVFYNQRGYALLPAANLRQARKCYDRWGAKAKVRQLDTLYPDLVEAPRRESSPMPSADAEPIDSLTAAKASAAISSEMSPDELLATLMRILTEHAGAQRACLLLPTAEGLSFAAEITADHDGVRVDTSRNRNAPSANEFPISVAQYVRRTREKLVLDDVASNVTFASDPYVAARRPKSLLCAPIVRRGEVAGILYLENRLARGAFTPKRLSLLEFLSAISLENALLAADLVRETATRTRAEKTLKESEERLQRLVETANVVPWEADRITGRFTYVGPQVVKMLGYPQDAWYSDHFLGTHVHPEDRESTLLHLVAASGEDDFDFRIRAADGRTVWLHNVVSVRGGDGSDTVGGFLFDVTERKESESTLKDKLRIIEEQQTAIQKLSTPIIEVWEGVLTVPVLGIVDEQRAEQMMMTLLDAVTRTGCQYTIIDLTGVDAVDTGTADHLMRIVRAVQLLGAQSIVVGIRPEVAQTIVSMGVDLSSISTLATLRQALLMCMGGPRGARKRG